MANDKVKLHGLTHVVHRRFNPDIPLEVSKNHLFSFVVNPRVSLSGIHFAVSLFAVIPTF
jgi:hypothetical protein